MESDLRKVTQQAGNRSRTQNELHISWCLTLLLCLLSYCGTLGQGQHLLFVSVSLPPLNNNWGSMDLEPTCTHHLLLYTHLLFVV